jgi:hypothetical protein
MRREAKEAKRAKKAKFQAFFAICAIFASASQFTANPDFENVSRRQAMPHRATLIPECDCSER